MNLQTTLRVSLLVAAAVLFLSSVAAQTPEKSEYHVSSPPSSQSPGESEVPPEQKFIELSRTKKLSSPRRRPPSRRFRTTTSPPEPSTETSKAEHQTTPSTAEVPSTAAPSQTSTTSIPLSTTPVEKERNDTTDKQVNFTGIRAAKSDRGQVFTFTFQNPEDNSVKEKQPIQSRIPARFSPVFTSQTARHRGSVPQTFSETNQPDNLVINSGPPGDVPRARPSGRALNPSLGASQPNQISQSQNLEDKTVPVNVDAPITERRVKLLRTSQRPKSKTRPFDGQVIPSEVQVASVQPSPPVQLQLVIANDGHDLAREDLQVPTKPHRPLKEGLRVLKNQEPLEELPPQPSREAADPSLQTLIANEGQNPSDSPAIPRIRYVKAGSLRFLPNRPPNPEELPAQAPHDFAEPTIQTVLEDEVSTARKFFPEQSNLPPRPLRPGSIRFLPSTPAFPEDSPPEPTRNFVEPTLQTLVANEGQDPLQRENIPLRPNRPLKPGSLRFLPNIPDNPQELPPQLTRDFAEPNLRTLISNEELAPERFSSPPRSNRPLKQESVRFLPNIPASPEALPPQVTRDYADPALQISTGNIGQDPSIRENLQPNRPLSAGSLRFLANHPEIPPELALQLAREFVGPTSPTLTVNGEQVHARGRSQERPSEALNAESFRFLSSNPQGLPPQLSRDFDTKLQLPIENEGQNPDSFSIPASPNPNRLIQSGSLGSIPNNQVVSREQRPSPGRGLSDANIQNLLLNGRRVIHTQSAERLSPQIPETPIRLQPVNAEPEINAFPTPPERPSTLPNNAREPSNQLQPNQKGEPANSAPPTNPQPNVPRPIEQSSPPSTADLPARVQTSPQSAIANPGFFGNPQTNIPRLIIEFPSHSAPGDSSIRLQLNPNSLPASSGSTNPQPNIPRAHVQVPTSPTPTEPSNQNNQQALPANGGATISSQSVSQTSAQLPSATVDSSIRVQPNLQPLPVNTAPAITAQSNLPEPPAELPAPQTRAGVSNSFQLNQQAFTNAGSTINTQSNIPQLSATAIQPSPQLPGANFGPAINALSTTPPHIPSALSPTVRNPSTTLQPISQITPSSPTLSNNPLFKTLAFSNQIPPASSIVTRDPPSLNSQVSANPNLAFNSLSNSRTIFADSSVTRDLSTKPQLDSQVIPQGPNTSAQSKDSKLTIETVTTPPVAREVSTASTEPGNNSLNSKNLGAESKPTVTDTYLKSNVQVPPVDVRLTINFNSNIPGFPSQLPPTTGPAQTNTSQQNAPTAPPQIPSPVPPNISESPTRLHLQPVSSGPAINALSTFPSFSDNPSSQVSSTTVRSQQNFQAPVNFRSTFSPQFNAQPVTPATSFRSQPFSQFIDPNAGPSFTSQFNNPGRPFELRSTQPSQFSTAQDSFARFQQNSQFSSTNVGLSANSQFNNPGRPFQPQSQQPSAQDFLSRFQPNSQFLTGNAGSINSQFNNFGQLPTTMPPTAQDSFNQAAPQVFTTNTGLAVNNLLFSPGLSVELLPPVKSDSRENQRVPATNEQPRVNFLVNSPELTAELLPPVISQSSVSSQSSAPQPSPQPPFTRFSSVSFQSNSQGIAANVGRNFPTHLLELLPPIDPLFPQPTIINAVPSPIDIPKPPVPALVPPPREQLTIPIDIPKPDVPALVPPPREHIGIPIDIPKPDVLASAPPREHFNIPIDIPRPDVPALVPPPREHVDTPIDIPKPDVPALVPPPRPSDFARLTPPTPTTFFFNPSNNSNLFQETFNPNQPNLQSQQFVQSNSDNPVLILPKSNSRQPVVQARLNNHPILLEDLSKKIGFLPQNQPAPFSASLQRPTTSTPTQTGTSSLLQITDIRAGRVKPVVQEVLTEGITSQPPSKTDTVPSPITFLRSPVHIGLEPPLIPISQSPPQSASEEKSVQSNLGQPSTNTFTPTVSTPTHTLNPPLGQDFVSTSTLVPSEQQTVNIGPRPTAESPAPLGPKSTPQTLQALPQPPQEGFVIFQTPTITVTTQSNRPDSPINVRVITQGGTGLIKPNTTLTAEPVRPANPQTSLFIQPEDSGTSTPTPQQPVGSTTPTISTSTIPNLPGTSAPLNQRISEDPSSTLAASLLPPLDPGFIRNNFTNPFTPQFSPPFLSSPIRSSDITFSASHGPGTACPKLDLQHKGHRAPQFGGNLILSPGFYPPDEPSPNLCEKPQGIEGKKFNWWQILLNHGGEPSTLSRSNEAEDVKIPALTNPCVRPFETEGVPIFYNITKTDLQTYYREEIAYHRLPDAKNTFLESRGLFIWTQAKSSFDKTAFLVLYTRDDSGFWVQIKNVNCQFDRNVQPNLQCRSVPECLCERGEKRCTESVPVLTRNFPVKTFRF